MAACCAAGDQQQRSGHAAGAERQYRAALQIDPRHTYAHTKLAYLLGVEGRRWESLPHLTELLQQNKFSIEALLLIGDLSLLVQLPDELGRWRQAAPDDCLPCIGLGRAALETSDLPQALRLLRTAVECDPDQPEAQVQLGEALMRASDEQGWLAWHAAAPASAGGHPDLWRQRGQWAKQHRQLRAAARCFWEAVRLDPNQQASIFQLAQLLQGFGRANASKRLERRATLLQDFSATIRLLYRNRDDLHQVRRAAELAESLGRLWEAWGWYCWARHLRPDASWATETAHRLAGRLSPDLPLTVARVMREEEVELAGYPLPDFTSLDLGEEVTRDTASNGVVPHFHEMAATVGIDFTYFDGTEELDVGRRMFQFTGGGVAALDYDGDGWSDLYFTQGTLWPPGSGRRPCLDRLYRNLSNDRFADVTTASGLEEDRFSQGVTVGDFDNDGFADVYVANVRVNRLYKNCGDGTFMDVTEAAQVNEADWTTSCLLADLNADGFPDIYDVNYVAGEDVYEKMCVSGGKARVCTPGVFRAAPDRLLLNLGDGRFADVTSEAGAQCPGGNGMGIVAADLSGTRRLNLFVANDQDANFYLVNATDRPGDAPKFHERGIASGLAFDGAGRALAGMGVAAGDANGDGALDLFVTNFHGEANTLYQQEATDSFIDVTARANLAAPSLSMLGFGAQFIDAELDGNLDLFVANGHIDDFRFRDIPYRMRPQFFRNVGGRFVEAPSDQLGEYFEDKFLGRAAARLDFNRDGREDIAISNLDGPSALLSNLTAPAGNFLAVQLRGTRGSRDAIGTVVVVSAGKEHWTAQLVAGDGYQASNQRQLLFGIGPHERVDELTIHWPSGLDQLFGPLTAGCEILFVEGWPEPVPIPH